MAELTGVLRSIGELTGTLRSNDIINGVLDSPDNLNGALSNIALRGAAVQLRVYGETLQWKYETEDTWHDLMAFDYMDASDAMTNLEIEELLANN